MYQLEQIGHYRLVAKLYVTLCDPKNCSTPVFPVLHYLSEFAQTHVHWVSDDIQPAHPVILFFSCLQSFPASGSFPMSQLFTSGGQRIRVSAPTSGFPMNILGWFPLGLTVLISLASGYTWKYFGCYSLPIINTWHMATYFLIKHFY